MAVTISPTLVGSTITLTGSGYSGSLVNLAVAFVSADGKRKYLELSSVPLVAGALTASVPVKHTSGTITVKAIDPTSITGSVLATATPQTV